MKVPHWHPPAQWDEAKYRDLFRKIRSEAKAVASGAPPESWSHNQKPIGPRGAWGLVGFWVMGLSRGFRRSRYW